VERRIILAAGLAAQAAEPAWDSHTGNTVAPEYDPRPAKTRRDKDWQQREYRKRTKR
jgi:hypothetical protein